MTLYRTTTSVHRAYRMAEKFGESVFGTYWRVFKYGNFPQTRQFAKFSRYRSTRINCGYKTLLFAPFLVIFLKMRFLLMRFVNQRRIKLVRREHLCDIY